MAEEKGYGLLISAIVSIVAIVGMVVLFSSGASTGQVSISGKGMPFDVKGGDRYAFQPGESESGMIVRSEGKEYDTNTNGFESNVYDRATREENSPCYYAESGELTCPGVESAPGSFGGERTGGFGGNGAPADMTERQLYPQQIQAYGRAVTLG